MLFNSFHFLLFYVLVLIAYFAMPRHWRWVLLLVASYYFYMCWKPAYALLLTGLTLACYTAALGMERCHTPALRRACYIGGLMACIGLLVFYKYLDFVSLTLSAALGAFDVHWDAPLLHLLIPVGISFHTFQSIGYLSDVHAGKIRAERHLGIYGLFIVFFPQLLAGPIERSGHMLPQFHREHSPGYGQVSSGARWALWGLFKKMAIADLLSPFVSRVYAHPQGVAGPILLLATFFFTIQIYCDFSGYSDIALGIARIMGYELMVNFRQPYLSRSISEFWGRWHISLSTWFRDYVYIPLGGSRVSTGRWVLNILVVFLISGLWHGASVLFLFWGLLHGTFLLVERGIQSAWKRAGWNAAISFWALPGTIITFVLVLIAWVLFRAQSTVDALYIYRHFWQLHHVPMDSFFSFGLPRFEFMLAFLLIGVLAGVELFLRYRTPVCSRLWRLRPIRWTCYAGCFYGIIFFGIFDRVEFIYFQF